jgi:hypothetical protein
MLKRYKITFAGLAVATLLASGTWVGTALGRENTSPAPDKLALGENEVKQLLLLMDQDKDGKISKQDFMSFMDAEFSRLDRDQSGKLDVKELTQSRPRTRPGVSR